MPDYIYNQVLKAMQEEFDRALNQGLSAAPGSYQAGLGFKPNYGSVMPEGSYQLPGGRWIIPAEGGGTQSQPMEPDFWRYGKTQGKNIMDAYRGGWNPSEGFFNSVAGQLGGLWGLKKERETKAYFDKARNPNLYLFPQGGAYGNTGQASPGPYGFMGQPPGASKTPGSASGVSGQFPAPTAMPPTAAAPPATPDFSNFMSMMKRPKPSGYAARFYRG